MSEHTPENDAATSAHCGRGPCWLTGGHDGPCEPGGRNDPRRAAIPAIEDDDAPECERCEGTGDRFGRAYGPKVPCPACAGTGNHAPRSEGLGRIASDLLAEHWPDSRVNGWYLADLLRERGVYVIPPALREGQ